MAAISLEGRIIGGREWLSHDIFHVVNLALLEILKLLTLAVKPGMNNLPDASM